MGYNVENFNKNASKKCEGKMATINDIAKLIGGKVIGDGALQIKGMAPLELAEEGDITFALSEEDIKTSAKSKASCILTHADAENHPKTLLKVENMKLAMTVLYNAMLEMQPPKKGVIHPSAIIAKTAQLGRDVSIGPNTVIGEKTKVGDNTIISANCAVGNNVLIGNKAMLYPNVTIYDNNAIGNRVIIHSGSVIGADGFGYVPKDGKIYKVPQMGRVVIEDDVEIGANTCIDRGTFTTTVIGKGTKIDNLVQIAHNVRVAKNVIIAGQTGIAGSSTIGENTMMGGNVGIADHSNIGKNVKIGAKTGVTGHVKDDAVIFGYPHRSAEDAKKLHGLLSLLLKNMKKFRKMLRSLPEE